MSFCAWLSSLNVMSAGSSTASWMARLRFVLQPPSILPCTYTPFPLSVDPLGFIWSLILFSPWHRNIPQGIGNSSYLSEMHISLNSALHGGPAGLHGGSGFNSRSTFIIIFSTMASSYWIPHPPWQGPVSPHTQQDLCRSLSLRQCSWQVCAGTSWFWVLVLYRMILTFSCAWRPLFCPFS